MVLPTPATDDPLRPETGWIEAIQRTLRLSKGGVLVHVDHAGPERLGDLARALLVEWPDLDVLDGVAGLETAPEGATRVLVPHVEEALWLNLNRPIVSRRNLKIVLWCDHATTVELSRKAPDFFDWISAHVECPKGLVPFALAGFRAAIRAEAPGIHWTGNVDEAARHRVSTLLEACVPGALLRWIDVEGPYEEVVRRVESIGREGTWVGAVADVQWKVWRFRWACAEAKSACREIVAAPGLECPGFWPVHDRMMSLGDACGRLSNAGVARAGLCASLLQMEPEAVDFAQRLLAASMSEQEMVELLLLAQDPGVALAAWAQEQRSWPALEPCWPTSTRHEGKPAVWTHRAGDVEAALRRDTRDWRWLELARLAFELGDRGAAASWAPRLIARFPEMGRDAESIAQSIDQGDFEQAMEVWRSAMQRRSRREVWESMAPILAHQLLAEGERYGVTTERFATRAVNLARSYIRAGAPHAAIPILRRILGPKELERHPTPAEDLAPASFPFLESEESTELSHFVERFLAAPPPQLSPETAAVVRDLLIEGFRAQGRFEEAALLTSERSKRTW